MENILTEFLIKGREDLTDYMESIDTVLLWYVKSNEYVVLSEEERIRLVDSLLELKTLISSMIKNKDTLMAVQSYSDQNR